MKKELSNIIKYLNEGKILSLVSDAGTPLLSDPGRLLVQACNNNNIDIVPIPGASSITASMSVSGFDDKFLFYGFLPKTEKIRNNIKNLSLIKFTQIFFIPGNKINFILNILKTFTQGENY